MKTPFEILEECTDHENGTVNIVAAMEAYHTQFMQNAIHAKALRKRGTKEWYSFKVKQNISQFTHIGDWITVEFPDMNSIKWSNIPPDAELVSVIIFVQEGGEG